MQWQCGLPRSPLSHALLSDQHQPACSSDEGKVSAGATMVGLLVAGPFVAVQVNFIALGQDNRWASLVRLSASADALYATLPGGSAGEADCACTMPDALRTASALL